MDNKEYEERSKSNTKYVQMEENERLKTKNREPNDQNRMKSVENRRI
ncbi:hypothetical protein [Domibacillus indicus]|nr:hypothetical protein [Domibacillus indicus]